MGQPPGTGKIGATLTEYSPLKTASIGGYAILELTFNPRAPRDLNPVTPSGPA